MGLAHLHVAFAAALATAAITAAALAAAVAAASVAAATEHAAAVATSLASSALAAATEPAAVTVRCRSGWRRAPHCQAARCAEGLVPIAARYAPLRPIGVDAARTH